MTTLTEADRKLAAGFAGPLETAHGITRIGMCKVSGRHLSEAQNTALAPDHIGEQYGLWTVVAAVPREPNRGPRVICRCNCGTTRDVDLYSLTTGKSRSCGCELGKDPARVNRAGGPRPKHGQAQRGERSATYRTWQSMNVRCKNAIKYPHHAGKGITVCERWRSFENFLADMGERPPGTTLDRYPDLAGNYEPGNCRWATISEQQRNTCRNINITHAGVTMCRKDWAAHLGITKERLRNALARGETMESIVATWAPRKKPNSDLKTLKVLWMAVGAAFQNQHPACAECGYIAKFEGAPGERLCECSLGSRPYDKPSDCPAINQEVEA